MGSSSPSARPPRGFPAPSAPRPPSIHPSPAATGLLGGRWQKTDPVPAGPSRPPRCWPRPAGRRPEERGRGPPSAVGRTPLRREPRCGEGPGAGPPLTILPGAASLTPPLRLLPEARPPPTTRYGSSEGPSELETRFSAASLLVTSGSLRPRPSSAAGRFPPFPQSSCAGKGSGGHEVCHWGGSPQRYPATPGEAASLGQRDVCVRNGAASGWHSSAAMRVRVASSRCPQRCLGGCQSV